MLNQSKELMCRRYFEQSKTLLFVTTDKHFCYHPPQNLHLRGVVSTPASS